MFYRRSSVRRFLRHLHTGESCRVCNPAAVPLTKAADHSPKSTPSPAPLNVQSSQPPQQAQANHLVHKKREYVPSTSNIPQQQQQAVIFPHWVEDPLGERVTTESRKEAALRRMLEIEHAAAPRQTLETSRDEKTDRLWQQFRRNEPLSPSELQLLVDALDRLAHGEDDMKSAAEPTAAEPCRSSNESTATRQQLFRRTLERFLSTVKRLDPTSSRTGGPSSEPSFFLCCGTALGAWREGTFIEHDNDVDVGIFYEDLVRIGAAANQSRRDGDGDEVGSSTPRDDNDDDVAAASQAVASLIAELTGEMFMCIDVIGSVDKGLELRFQHLDTQVLLDVNVYYAPLPGDRETAGGDSFVWCATHYGESHKRKHGMYRYRHAPFRHLLVQKNEFAATVDSSGDWPVPILVPPITYLEEYFGPGWRVPVKYDYAQGLAEHYRNIIPE